MKFLPHLKAVHSMRVYDDNGYTTFVEHNSGTAADASSLQGQKSGVYSVVQDQLRIQPARTTGR
jgi:hypothetical protein